MIRRLLRRAKRFVTKVTARATDAKENKMCMSQLCWERSDGGEAFLVRLTKPECLDVDETRGLLDDVVNADGLDKDFSSEGERILREWLKDPTQPLPFVGPALVSNWFMTSQSGARNSERGLAARRLWDGLFLATPLERLTETNNNDRIILRACETWWVTQSAWQGHRDGR